MHDRTVADASLIDAPKSIKNHFGERDPEMHQTQKGNEWYLSQEAQIPDLIDYSQPLKQPVYQAFFLRNKYRTTARELIANRELDELLYRTAPNLIWSEVIQKQLNKGLTGDGIYNAIIQSSQRSRKSAKNPNGVNIVIFNPNNVKVEEIMR